MQWGRQIFQHITMVDPDADLEGREELAARGEGTARGAREGGRPEEIKILFLSPTPAIPVT